MAFILTEEQQMMVDLARDFARKEIKEILINLKRVDFINKVKEELYQRASDRNKINYYYLNSNE